MTATLSQTLARFVVGLTPRAVPAEIKEKAKTQILDTLGIALAASSLPYVEAFCRGVAAVDGSSQASVIGRGMRLSAPSAALVNGTLAHSLDFDDTHIKAIVHMSASIVPAALAVGEWTGSDGASVLAAIVAGYEVAARIGLAAMGAFHQRGFHPTLLCGVFGCTAAVGKLLGLNEEQLTHAFGIAGSQAGGIQQFLKDGSEVKRFHAGWASHSGVMAALLARSGLTGPPRIFEGEYGLFRTHLGAEPPDLAATTRDLGTVWETAHIGIKPYPCCHFLHAFMDASLRVKREHGVALEDIEAIICMVPKTIVPLVCEPLGMKRQPPDPYAALFSMPFCVATMLLKEHAGLDDFSEQALGNRDVLDLASHVGYAVDEEWTEFPRYFSGWAIVRLRDGRKFQAREKFNSGSPEHPLTAQAIEEKFMLNARRRVSEEGAEHVMERVRSLDQLATLAPLTEACGGVDMHGVVASGHH